MIPELVSCFSLQEMVHASISAMVSMDYNDWPSPNPGVWLMAALPTLELAEPWSEKLASARECSATHHNGLGGVLHEKRPGFPHMDN